MIERETNLANVKSLIRQFPVVALIGVRQVGKTTLVQMLMQQWSEINFADGRFGSAARAALKQFQESYGLTPDGVYRLRTTAALNGLVPGACK